MIEKDKFLHFAFSFIFSVLGAAIIHKVAISYNPEYEEARAVAMSTLFVFIGGIGKELYDKYGKKTKFDVMDVFADLCGIGLAAFSMLII